MTAIFRPLLSCALLAAAASAFAADAPAAAAGGAGTGAANPLRAAIRHPAPAYVAGARFRTPEGIEGALAEQAAQRLGRPLAVVPIAAAAAPAALLERRAADLVVATLPPADPLRRAGTPVPTGYVASPMAILRSDTDIRDWARLKGRTVCMAEGGRYVGTIAARYGAIEKILRAPADALLALRTGRCDAMVDDSALLDALLRLPEWKKYSATLRGDAGAPLAFVVPADDAALAAVLRETVGDWSRSGYLARLQKKRADSIAFEVYLDQDVPDCH